MTVATADEYPSLWLPMKSVRIVLRGIGQVLFQDNAATGLLFLIGIAVASPLMAVGSVIGAVVGPLIAGWAGFDYEETSAGIYGFNPVLVGIASLFYLRPRVLTWCFVVVGCVAATFLTNLMRRHLKFPTYTAPFVLVTWVVIIIVHAIAGTAIDVTRSAPSEVPISFLVAVLRGTAEIMFGANIVTGLLFIVGIAISNWRHALLAVFGSMVGTILGIYHHNAVADISLGIYGYNASLASIALYLWRKSLLISLLAAAISIPITEFFPSSQLGVPPLTAPFVIASWIVILIGQIDVLFMRDQTAR